MNKLAIMAAGEHPISTTCTVRRYGHGAGKGQIPLGPVARNFLVANDTRKSPTSYGLVTRKSGVSPTCYEEVGDFQTIPTCQDGLACR